ncbi:hypothetical protein SCYAM73S_07361 [Streptomyces cyaneofuscatus]
MLLRPAPVAVQRSWVEVAWSAHCQNVRIAASRARSSSNCLGRAMAERF